jgi:spore maturation protein CgeB
MKAQLKKIKALAFINSKIKAALQEKHARDALNYYQRKADKKGLTVPNGNELKNALRQRLRLRGICPAGKAKGNLHIFLAFSLSNWEFILPIALKQFGRVTSFEWVSLGYNISSKSKPEIRDNMNVEMLEKIKEAHSKQPIDALIGYFTDISISAQILKQVSDMGITIFNFSWDDKLHFRNSQIASAVDLNLTNAPSSCIKHTACGGLSMFWPEAAHSEVHRPFKIPFEHDVSFVGKNYGWRSIFIKKLRKMGVKVEAFGFGWENGPLSNEDMIELYSRSRINLGFAGVGHSKKLMCLKGRDFEVPMSGGLYLTQDNPELSLVYDVGREIVTYMNEKDCAEKIKWLLAHPDEADKIRKQGRARATRDHSWEKRFEDAFKMTGII